MRRILPVQRVSSDSSRAPCSQAVGYCRFFGAKQLLLLLILLAPCRVAALPDEQTAPRSKAAEAQATEFNYEVEGRHDPFLPFLTVKSTKDDEIVEEDGEGLSGLRRYEPRQLTLVAILRASDEHVAMVQDDTGIGYALREGMHIGRRGVIERITSGEVHIRETARTRGGKEVAQSIVMRFNKDGEK